MRFSPAGRVWFARRRGILLLSLAAALPLGAAGDPAADLDRARALVVDGHIRQAVESYQAIAEHTRDSDPSSAAIALNNTCVLLVNLSEAEAALPACEEALALRRKKADDPLRLARALNNMGRVLRRLGRYREAAERTREALTINRTRGHPRGEVINLANLGVIATLSGRYGEALERYRQVTALAEAHADEPWADAQRRLAILNQGVVLERLGAYDEALVNYRRLIAEGEQLPPSTRAGLLANLATLYRNLGDPVRAAEAIREAGEVSQRLEDAAGVANAKLNLGLILHHNLSRASEAEAAYGEALTLAEQLADADTEIEALLNLGDLLLEGERTSEARNAFERARGIAATSNSADGLSRALDGLGRVAERGDDLPAALGYLERAMTVLEGVRAGLDRAALRASFLHHRRRVFASTVEVLAKLAERHPDGGYADRALEVVQRAKHRELLQAVGRGEHAIAPQSAAALRRAAGSAVVLEYFVAGTQLYRWSLSRRKNLLSNRGSAAAIDADVRTLHRSLAAGESPRPTVLARLAETLLGDALPPRVGKVFIAPDSLLHYLPFELLAPPETPGQTLLDRATVAYLPSASLLTRPAPSVLRPARRVLAFGAPSMASSTGAEGESARGLLRARFALAPIEARELDRIGAALGGRREIHRGSEATEAALRAAAPAGAAIVHFATHTVVDERMQAGAAVLMTPSGEDDGLLFPEEVAGLRLNTDLTVLATCSTALGSGQEGRGLSSLTGAFLAAGSRAVVATLWDVGDAEAAVFMEQLYYQLGRGLTPAEALRQAKQRMRADATWQRPALWAAYVLIGDAPPVVKTRWLGGRDWWLALAATLGLLTAVWVFRRR